MNDQIKREIIIADPVNFHIVALKNYAEIYYVCKYLGKNEYASLVELAVKEGMVDGEVDKMAVGEWWNERVSSPIFRAGDVEPPPNLIIP